MRTKPMQLSVMAVAALAIVAVAAAMLLAGGGSAQADTATHSVGGNPLPQQPQQTAPEACDENPVPVYGSGDGAKRLALFDVYWHTERKNLVNNPCPPTITHVPAVPGSFGTPGTPARDDRTASDVDIRQTIIHIPSSYNQTLSFSSTSDRTTYPFMFEDDNLRDSDNDGVNDALVDDAIWVLPTCDPDYTDTDGTNTAMPQTGAAAGDDDLCLIFSAALLDPANWVSGPKQTTAGDVQFEFEAVREPGINPADRGAVFAFQPYNAPGVTQNNQVTWRTDDADTNELMITPGTYEYRQWGFTRPGTYDFQLHVKGHPRNHVVHGAVIDTRSTTTSEVIHYRFHVGLLAELNTGITADDTTPDVGDTVTLTVTANNEGPGAGNDAQVQVSLPEGLSYVSSQTATGSYDSATGVWSLGTMAAPAEGAGPTTATLTITATVDTGTRGQSLEVTATISATETIGSSTVDELDPHAVHHSSSVTITPAAVENTPPEWYVLLSVEEGSSSGTAVGDIIPMRDPDPDDNLSYNLTGEGHEHFLPIVASGGIQIAVGAGANLDYEVTPAYELLLTVSDGVDAFGNPDGPEPVVDDTVPVRIDIDDVNLPATVSLTIDNVNPTVGEEITLTAELLNGDQLQEVEYVYYSATTGSDGVRTIASEARSERNTHSISRSTAQTEDFFVRVVGHTYNPNGVEHVNSNTVTVTWEEAAPSQ